MAIERIDPQDVHPLVWGDHIHRYIWAKHFCAGLVLDAACGAAYGSEVLLQSEKVTAYVGVDISLASVQKADRSLGNMFSKMYQADCHKLPFKNESFDSIVCFETLEHVDEPEQVLKEFARIIKPSGLLIGSVPSRQQEQAIDDIYGHNPFHKHRFDANTIERILGAHFSSFEVFYQSLEVFDVISPAASTDTEHALIDPNPSQPAFAPGPILFIASIDKLPEEIITQLRTRVLHTVALYTIERDHNTYIRDLETQRNVEQEKVATLITQVANEQAHVQQLTTELAGTHDELRNANEQAASMREELQGASEQVANTHEELCVAYSQHGLLQEQIELLSNQLTGEHMAAEELIAQLDDKQKHIQSLSMQIEQYRQDIQRLLQTHEKQQSNHHNFIHELHQVLKNTSDI